MTPDLKQIALHFRNGLLGKRPSDQMCFAVCYALRGYLQMLGITTELIEGEFMRAHHCWLVLSDGRVLDPTQDQFSGPLKRFPKVYLGPALEFYSNQL